MKIKSVRGFQVLDSRGRPTVACTIELTDGSIHTARVPAGASTGLHEAHELRDAGTSLAEKFYGGKSVYTAVNNINNRVASKLIGQIPSVQNTDSLLVEIDPSDNHSTLGANATLAVSLATLKAASHANSSSVAHFLAGKKELLMPMPMVNILSGGAHANRALDIQDVLVLPHGAKNFTQALSWVVAVREEAARAGKERGLLTHLVADEGGLGIPFASIDKACEFVTDCISHVGLRPGTDISIALDIAATQFFSDGTYSLPTINKSFTSPEFAKFLTLLVNNHPIISIEDPFAEDDWSTWQEFSQGAPSTLQIVGDDLFTTNLKRLNRGIENRSANSILIKPNQNGLVSSTAEVLKHAQKHAFSTIVSARSGETEDSWLADIAVGWSAGQIKVGSTHGSERTAKWNRLLEIEANFITKFAQPFRHISSR